MRESPPPSMNQKSDESAVEEVDNADNDVNPLKFDTKKAVDTGLFKNVQASSPATGKVTFTFDKEEGPDNRPLNFNL